MTDPLIFAAGQVRDMIDKAFGQAVKENSLPDVDIPEYTVETPNDNSHGDFAANIAMVGARTLKMAPRAAAEIITKNIGMTPMFKEVQIAGPGFINFFFSEKYYSDALASILRRGRDFGKTDYGKGKKVMVEFVSANPTGPMHLGNARGGALGDCIAAALEAAGYETCREFYVNDAGNQIEKFAVSLEARYLSLYKDGIAFPEDGYHGDDITERAKEFDAEYKDTYVDASSEERKAALVAFALPKNIAAMKQVLHDYRIDYDVWFLESTLHNDGSVCETMDKLTANGYTYELDGALWYKATEFGSEKDEVLVKSNGFFTYFAVDIAYHYNKLVTRGFDIAIDVWGADHHGHVERMKGAMDALGVGGDRLDVVLMQLVNLVRDGEPVRMSKRTGKSITLTDLLEEISVDAARFYFNLREYSSHFDFDLDLAVKQSSDNPVYYVQYAHARICSILKALEADGIALDNYDICNYELLAEDDERALIRKLAALPSEITAAARERDPARIIRYVREVASLFHRFYTSCRVKVDDKDLCMARTALCLATRQVIRNCLDLLKITAPETM